MSLKKKVPCFCTKEYYRKTVRYGIYDLDRFPSLCPWCHGTKEIEETVNPLIVDGFDEVDWNEVTTNWSEEMINITCPCGDEITLSPGNIIACSCGRVYQCGSLRITVNEQYIGKQDELIKMPERK